MSGLRGSLNCFNGELYDFCFELIGEEGKIENFEYVCKNYKGLAEDDLNAGDASIEIDGHFSELEISELSDILGETVDGLINAVIKKCNLNMISYENFYLTLWESFENNFQTQKELAFAFYYTLIDRRIPYVYLGKPLSMTNEEYRNAVDKNEDAYKKIMYIFKNDHNQKTEIASFIYGVLEECSSYEDKVVMLAVALEGYKRNLVLNKSGIDRTMQFLSKEIEKLSTELTS